MLLSIVLTSFVGRNAVRWGGFGQSGQFGKDSKEKLKKYEAHFKFRGEILNEI